MKLNRLAIVQETIDIILTTRKKMKPGKQLHGISRERYIREISRQSKRQQDTFSQAFKKIERLTELPSAPAQLRQAVREARIEIALAEKTCESNAILVSWRNIFYPRDRGVTNTAFFLAKIYSVIIESFNEHLVGMYYPDVIRSYNSRYQGNDKQVAVIV